MIIPTLETGRLRLRGHRVEDLDACTAMWADPRVTRYLSVQPLTREDVWARLLRYAGHWSLMGYGFWAVEEKATGAFVGEVGIAEFHREISPRLELPEAGWVLEPGAQGKGYATEALQAAVAWVQKRLTCLIHPENAASFRVAAKCGFLEVRRVQYKNHEAVVLER